ncbi:MAG: hypothetical protein ABSH50_30820 [Bryobacteraceae bacterium]|jgi:hypothetical protein
MDIAALPVVSALKSVLSMKAGWLDARNPICSSATGPRRIPSF